MTTNPQPPPEAELIRARREAAPYQSVKQAAKLAGISDTRWRQIEQGYRMHRGRVEADTAAPAPILARMALTVGVTPAELEQAGRPDAAAELAALVRLPVPGDGDDLAATMRRIEAKLDALLSPKKGTEPTGHEGNGSRRAG